MGHTCIQFLINFDISNGPFLIVFTDLNRSFSNLMGSILKETYTLYLDAYIILNLTIAHVPLPS